MSNADSHPHLNDSRSVPLSPNTFLNRYLIPLFARTTPPTRFSDLPIELRLHIWRFTLPRQRIVEVIYDSNTAQTFSTTRPPSLLRVCRESRYETLRYFRLLFGPSKLHRHIYLDVDFDTLLLSIPRKTITEPYAFSDFSLPTTEQQTYLATLLSGINRVVAHDLKHVAVDSGVFTVEPFVYDDERIKQLRVLLDFRNLRKLTVMMCEFVEGRDDLNMNLELVDPVEARCLRHRSGRSTGEELESNCKVCLELDRKIQETLWPDYEFMESYRNFRRMLNMDIGRLTREDEDWKVPKSEVLSLIRWRKEHNLQMPST